jgi:uncharacterized protein involved in outer membrane biogenesis
VQTTLLSIAIAFILALITALIGPYFVNWSDHRALFEREASRLVGLQVRVSGEIDVGLLPVPSVTLGGVEIGPAGQERRLRARSVSIELGLGPLMRGEIRAADMRVVGPEFSIGLNSTGQIDWPSTALASDTLSIERLNLEDGRAVLTEAASGSRVVLENLQFTGDVKSLAGPVRGEGAFKANGSLYNYRIAAGRLAEEGMRLRLTLDKPDQPLSIDADGMLAFEGGVPRFEGNLTAARPAGAENASGKAVANEPWRMTGKAKVTQAAALLEQLEYQYGPDERAVKLGGAAEVKFGRSPSLQGALSARQIDLDRLIAGADAPRRLPLASLQAFADMFGGSLRPPIPVNVALSVDAVTLSGATLQTVGSDVRFDGEGWHLDKLEFRAPGFAQVRLSGRLSVGRSLGFAGAASIDVNDPKTLVGWLAGRPSTATQIKPWRAQGEITLGADRIAVERLKTEFDRGSLEGRLAYVWSSGNRPARLDADLSAGELDIDALMAFGDGALSGLGLERPREIALALEIGRARIAGIEARDAKARLKLDPDGLAIERLSVGDFGNSTLEASGRIETTSSPHGNITVDLDARDLGGVIALAERFAPQIAVPLRRVTAGQRTAKLRAGVSLERGSADSATAKLSLNGRIGAVRVDGSVSATGKPEAFVITDLQAATASELRLDARLEADEGSSLLGLIGLDRIPVADKRAARLNVSARGPLGGTLNVEGRLTAGPIDAEGKGTARLFAGAAPVLEFERVAGSFAGSKGQGKLTVTYADQVQVAGAVEVESIDAPALVAAAIGMRVTGSTAWSSEPFALSASEIGGRIELRAPRAVISPSLVARDFRAVARFGTSQVVFEDVQGNLAGGRLAARLAFAGSPDGLSARGHLALTGVDAAAVLPKTGAAPVSGRLTLQTEVEGAGLSPAAFIGSLAGQGTVVLESGQIAGLNPRTFDAVIRAVDLGVSADANRVRDFTTSALDNGSLPVARAEAALAIAAGQVRLANVVTRVNGAELGATGTVNLADASIDGTLTLTGTATAGASIHPVVFVALKGPLSAPKRTVDVNAFTSWLALRAVEQQSKRLEALEQARREPPSQPSPAPPTQPAAADTRPAPDTTNALPLRETREAAPAVPAAVETTSGLPQTEQAPALPPAVTIPQAPKPRATAPRQTARPAVRPAPTQPRQAPESVGPPLDLLSPYN